MRVYPYKWGPHPTIRIQVEEGDRPKLKGKKPSPMDWLARRAAGICTERWSCGASNVFPSGSLAKDLSAHYVLYVPSFTGFVSPTGDVLESDLYALMAEIAKALRAEGFEIAK